LYTPQTKEPARVMLRLLRPPHSGIFRRSFPLHGTQHAPETIAESCSLWNALATASITRAGSTHVADDAPLSLSRKNPQ
jgi:hypothetical protein